VIAENDIRLEPVAGPRLEKASPAIEVSRIARSFGSVTALADVTFEVGRGEIQALLGPNGAGKTTLIKLLSGVVEVQEGSISVLGTEARNLVRRDARKMFGLVPSGDRTFYLRLSGLENMIFFGRIYGLARRDAVHRAKQCIEAVGLTDAARKPVALYSHGMQKRLSVARGLIMDPPILLVDEATHDLDPEGAHRIQRLIKDAADNGAAVIWATQRLDEIRGFANNVLVLDHGRIRFRGTVPELMAVQQPRRYLLHVGSRNGSLEPVALTMQKALRNIATLNQDSDGRDQHFLVSLNDDVILGDAFARLNAAGITIFGCREERSGIEEAFLHLTGGGNPR
jgi:ABC-2 type transport system ATP-binding protein